MSVLEDRSALEAIPNSIDGLDRIVELLVPVLSTLEDVQLNMDKNGVVRAGTWNPKSREDARS